MSFTCSICDKRHTPASVRFLGRRVYLAVTVVLASALRIGLSGWRVSQLTEWIRVPKRTLERWRAWWMNFRPVTPEVAGSRRSPYSQKTETAARPGDYPTSA
jgi:hypothetical protein